MSAAGPKEVVVGFFDDVDAGNVQAAFARLAPDIAYHVVAPEPYGGALDLAGLGRISGAIFAKLAAPLKISVQTVVSEGDRVMVEAKSFAPTLKGGVYDNDYLFLYRVVDGKMVEAKEYLDSAKLVALMEDRL